MSRDDGFAIADVDAGLYADPKVVALARRLRDPRSAAVHVALYEALVLGSWGAGERITFEEALPAWWLEDVDDVRANLAAVGLVDVDGRIPDHAWEAWFQPAWDRRETRRAKARKGGLARPRPGSESAPSTTGADSKHAPRQPVRPSVRSVPADMSFTLDARETDDPAETVFEHLARRGVEVDRANGHAKMLRHLIERDGAARVIDAIDALPEVLDARQAVLGAANALRPIAPPTPGRHKRNTVDDDPLLRQIRDGIESENRRALEARVIRDPS